MDRNVILECRGLGMNTQDIINIGAGTVLAACGWVARELWGAIKELRADLHAIETHLPEKYVQKEDYSDNMKEIREICNKIFDKIEILQMKKVDK
jgi:hypothetical protein